MRESVEAILAGLDKKLGAGKPTAAAIRSKELAHRIATEPADSMPFDIEPGVLDPRDVISAIDAVVPKDWDCVVGRGHQAYFNTQMRGRPAERYTTVREFGAVGNGLSYALGVAAARRQGLCARRQFRPSLQFLGRQTPDWRKCRTDRAGFGAIPMAAPIGGRWHQGTALV